MSISENKWFKNSNSVNSVAEFCALCGPFRKKFLKHFLGSAVFASMRSRLTRASLFVLTLAPGLLTAEEPATSTPPSANIEVSTGGAGTSSKSKRRAVSEDVSKSVSSAFKYTPPPPEKPEEELVDMRDIDKPRNEIIRLPRYVVEAKKPPVFAERNLYSKEMLRRLAYQRYISNFSRNVLNKYKLPISFGSDFTPQAYAMMMYEAEERQRVMAEMDDKVSLLRISGDDAEADKTKSDAQDTFMRHSSVGSGTNHLSNGK